MCAPSYSRNEQNRKWPVRLFRKALVIVSHASLEKLCSSVQVQAVLVRYFFESAHVIRPASKMEEWVLVSNTTDADFEVLHGICHGLMLACL